MPSNPARSQTDGRLKANKERKNGPRKTQARKKVVVTMNQRYIDFVDGKIKPSELDDKEIEKGAIRGPNGKFGKQPAYVPSKFHNLMVTELKKRMEKKFAEDVEPMRKILKSIANNPRTSPDARYKSAVYLIDRGVGKVAEKTEAVVEVKVWEEALDEVFVDYDTKEASNDEPVKPARKRTAKKSPNF